jgi:ssDNA-binding replication factor A large subunit
MIDISFEEAVARIHQESGLPLPEIRSRIDAKLAQLAGLVSREGAAHILANELGIQLAKPAPAAGATLKIADVGLQSRNITIVGRVVQKYDVRSFSKNGRDGQVASLLLGDETGVIRVTFWNDQVDAFTQLNVGDVLEVRNPFVKPGLRADRVEAQLNTQSTIVVNPEGVVIAQREGYTPRAERPPAVQKYLKDLQGDEENVEIIATIVQVYDPRFFDSCPQCNRKLVSANQCNEHGEVVGAINGSMSAFLDDGTGNIRCTFWKQQALRLLGKTEADFVRFRDDPASFEDVKNDLLGEFVKVTGKVRKNDTFDRLEFTAQLVTKDIDPAKELEGLQKKFEQSTPSAPAASTVAAPGAISSSPSVPAKKDDIAVIEDDVMSLDDL